MEKSNNQNNLDDNSIEDTNDIDESDEVSNDKNIRKQMNDELVDELDELDEIDLDGPNKKSSNKKKLNSKQVKTKNLTKVKSSKEKGIIDLDPNEDTKKIQQLRTSLLQYIKMCPSQLEMYKDQLTRDQLETLSFDELKTLLDEVRVTLACMNSVHLIHGSYFAVCSIAEHASPYVGINMNGFTELISKNPAIINTLNEISLENDLIYVRPEYRLALATLSCANEIINYNRNIEKQKLKSQVTPTLFNENKDL